MKLVSVLALICNIIIQFKFRFNLENEAGEPKVRWARANIRLRGERMTLGCCGLIASFSRIFNPNCSIAPPIARCSSWVNFLPQLLTFFSSSSSVTGETSGAAVAGSSWTDINIVQTRMLTRETPRVGSSYGQSLATEAQQQQKKTQLHFQRASLEIQTETWLNTSSAQWSAHFL